MQSNYDFEIFKAGLSAITSLIALSLAWFVGNRITVRWALRQKRREMYLAVAADFYRLYGEFFAVWKLWNYLKREGVIRPTAVTDAQYRLLERACAAEAGVETIIVRLCAERNMSESDVRTVGSYRQAYSRLRENLREGQPIPWSSSDHREYLAFKTLASHVAAIVSRRDETSLPSPESVSTRLTQITSNEWETKWLDAAKPPVPSRARST